LASTNDDDHPPFRCFNRYCSACESFESLDEDEQNDILCQIGEILKWLIHDILKVERYQISRVISKKGEDEEIPEVSAEIIC
jgi:hypothetical protein